MLLPTMNINAISHKDKVNDIFISYVSKKPVVFIPLNTLCLQILQQSEKFRRQD